MAQLQATSISCITGTFSLLSASANTTTCGNLWYNPSINKLQYSFYGGAWSAGGALITARQCLAGAGTQNAGLAFGGGAPGLVSCTEEYNGTSWSVGGALSIPRYRLAGDGTQDSALAFGGGVTLSSCTEEYNICIQSCTL
jgi:hypothetical protein